MRIAEPVDVWLVKTVPATPRSPQLLNEWIQLNYDIKVCDPGKSVVERRQSERPRPYAEAGIRQWYRLGLDQQGIDEKLRARRTQLADLGLIAAVSPPERSARPEW
ncbi:hypothetical protein OZX72_02980 [Bifidobacterium sp. ESL0769]|uniref:hypothetical protein n=1 Tax=Bifidobacterium sp. ESL0769 TaxID=2983229 RepID=UPI0023F96150|nr:hypothetical protein [Bifidobacterium sp. ESL0769]WEV68473.1 hypothetical protein OZX72_02980 [Bifidobacterium sp. ESL0769]